MMNGKTNEKLFFFKEKFVSKVVEKITWWASNNLIIFESLKKLNINNVL